MEKITGQQRWNRYVDALNYCISLGYDIFPIMSKRSDNVRSIRVRENGNPLKETTITLKPKKYTAGEMYRLIKERL